MGAFDLTIGAFFVGFSFNLYLYGIVSYQYVSYATLKFDDPIWLRTLVAISFAIDTSQTFAEFYGIWYLAVENYANPIALTEVIWVWPFLGVANAIAALVVKSFFLYRLWGFTRRAWLCGFLTLLAAGACLCGVIASIKLGRLDDLTKLAPLIPLVTAWLALEAGVDIIITVILSKALWQSKTGSARTDTVIHRCIKAAVQSGLFSSVFAFACLLSFVFWNNTFLFTIFSWPLGRIYSYSLFYTLVIRKELSNIAYGSSNIGGAQTNSFPRSLQISSVHFRQDTTTNTQVDSDYVKSSLDQRIVLHSPEGSAPS
ncbi:hypothetical protein DL96DRAFT_1023496 [Flagelloscypha sp. PMI_526]|nr:hypothetical protein DL96DRAFT_1023496 [Flagelloscypha sp. PMI_526]